MKWVFLVPSAAPISRGVKCKVCKVTVHTKCQNNIPYCSGVSFPPLSLLFLSPPSSPSPLPPFSFPISPPLLPLPLPSPPLLPLLPSPLSISEFSSSQVIPHPSPPSPPHPFCSNLLPRITARPAIAVLAMHPSQLSPRTPPNSVSTVW